MKSAPKPSASNSMPTRRRYSSRTRRRPRWMNSPSRSTSTGWCSCSKVWTGMPNDSLSGASVGVCGAVFRVSTFRSRLLPARNAARGGQDLLQVHLPLERLAPLRRRVRHLFVDGLTPANLLLLVDEDKLQRPHRRRDGHVDVLHDPHLWQAPAEGVGVE